jgi:hypothetical protein
MSKSDYLTLVWWLEMNLWDLNAKIQFRLVMLTHRPESSSFRYSTSGARSVSLPYMTNVKLHSRYISSMPIITFETAACHQSCRWNRRGAANWTRQIPANSFPYPSRTATTGRAMRILFHFHLTKLFNVAHINMHESHKPWETLHTRASGALSLDQGCMYLYILSFKVLGSLQAKTIWFTYSRHG